MSSSRRRERRGRGRQGAGSTAARFFSDVRKAVGAPARGGTSPTCCALCRSTRLEYGGLWCPSTECQAKLLVPSGKQRLVGYGLCAKCAQLPDVGRRVEDAILADFAALAADPERN